MAIISPLDLSGINGYETQLSNSSAFCWRWHNDRRVVTIEDGNYSSQNSSVKLRPKDFLGVNGYADEISSTYFCWRWWDREHSGSSERYRFLTIEDSTHNDPHIGTGSIVPSQLKGTNGFGNEIGGLYFCWRWMERDGQRFRVVTIEDGEPQYIQALVRPDPRIVPQDLAGINGFANELNPSTRFCWRWFRKHDGSRYRCVTLEDGGESKITGFASIRPRDFNGVNSYEKEISDAYFCWRWLQTENGTNYRVITLEDDGYSPHKGSSKITPGFLLGVNGYHNDIEKLSFCWRWFQRDSNEYYRVLTLE